MEAIFIGNDGSMGLKTGKSYKLVVRVLDTKGCGVLISKLYMSVKFNEANNNDVRSILNLITNKKKDVICDSNGCFPIYPVILEITDDDGDVFPCPYDTLDKLFENWRFERSSNNSVRFVCDETMGDNQCFFKKNKNVLSAILIVFIIGLIISEIINHY
jgi:hypothetical protein